MIFDLTIIINRRKENISAFSAGYSKMKNIKIAFLGHGNVGGGTCQILKNNADLISQRINRKFEVTHILVSDANKPRNWPTLGAKLVTDFDDILNSNVDIIVEALGGIEPAASYMKLALE